jgi:hypothetical protein
LLFIFGIIGVFTQITDENWNYLLVREDVVKPSMTINCEASLVDLGMYICENNVKDVYYLPQYSYMPGSLLK